MAGVAGAIDRAEDHHDRVTVEGAGIVLMSPRVGNAAPGVGEVPAVPADHDPHGS